MRCLWVLRRFSAPTAGCVDRKMSVVTEPAGAKLYYNNRYVGETPVTFSFVYYQPPDIRIEKDGYDTLHLVQPLKTPWYERLPLDFFAETAPVTIHNTLTLDYGLMKSTEPDTPSLIKRADDLGSETMAGAE